MTAKSTSSVALLPFDKALHLEQVFSLYAEVFGPEAARAYRARWRWSQEENLFPQETPKWVLADEGRVVGFLTTIPQQFRIAGQLVLAHSPSDFMVSPKYQFHGIKLMREFFRHCDNCVSLDDIAATIAVLTWLKCKSAGTMHRYGKALDSRLVRRRLPWANMVPDIAFSPLNVGLRIRDKVRSRPRLEVQEIRTFDARFDRFLQRLAERAPAMMVRSAEYLNWRYGPISPHAHRTLGVIADAQGEIAGYVVACPSNDSEHTGFILELQTVPPHDEDLTLALVAFAVDRLHEQGAWMVRCHTMAGPTGAVLERFGFSLRSAKHKLLVKFKDERLFAVASEERNWNYDFGDAEASHSVASNLSC